MITIRREKSTDPASIRRVIDAAFGRPNESAAVEAMRQRGAIVLSLVAIRADTIIAQLLFTAARFDTSTAPVWLDGDPDAPADAAGSAAAAAPVARPVLQRRTEPEIQWVSLEEEFEKEERQREMEEVAEAAAAVARAAKRKAPAEKVTRVSTLTGGGIRVPEFAVMAPVAVIPNQQRRGIGSELVEAGLEQLSRLHARAVFVLGDSSYYSRFGFVSTRPFGIGCDPPSRSATFQVHELRAGTLAGLNGVIQFEPELRNLG